VQAEIVSRRVIAERARNIKDFLGNDGGLSVEKKAIGNPVWSANLSNNSRDGT
jgi:hypothetical protein